MSEKSYFNYLIHKSPLIRAFIVIFIITAALSGVFVFRYKNRPIPYIESLMPPIGRPGDVVTISGRNFGNERDINYVEFSGSKLTASSYLSWSDEKIKIVIPANIQDGLVVVGVGNLRSKPAFFANVSEIPVEVKESPVTTMPVITSISSDRNSVGNLITISGNNFGDSRNQSKVFFTIDYDNIIKTADYTNISMFTENMISAWDNDYNYEYWSNSEIKVRIPDGASTGVVIVETSSGKSEPYEIAIDSRVGTKSYTDKKIYLMQYSVDLAEIVSKNSATITLRCPVPTVSASQSSFEMTEVSPVPILENYQNTLIHQLAVERNIFEKRYFRQTFVLPVYAVSTKVNVDRVSSKNTPMSNALYAVATRVDELIPTNNDDIVELSNAICQKEKNPYKKAKLIYDYMISEFTIQEEFRKNDADPLDLLKSKEGDAYDFAIIYTALLRATDIPAFADCGILVSPDMMTRTHAWSEFYISGIGWIPVDVALGAGMKYNKWDDEIDAASYYFGNLDSHHVKFSRGINMLKPFSQDSKTVQRPRSFAFQSIWEEASNDTVKYSSFWSDPVIKGIY